MADMKLNININQGLTFNGNKLTLDIGDTGENIIKTDEGIYVPSLQGNPGSSGTIGVDNWTIINANSAGTKIKTSREVVQYIFSMCMWKVTNHTRSGYAVDESTMKTLADVITEANYVVDRYDYTAYNMKQNDLFMFKYSANPMGFSQWTHTTDDGNRYPGTKCHALFNVESIETLNKKVQTLSLRCLWCSDVAKSHGLVPGQLLL